MSSLAPVKEQTTVRIHARDCLSGEQLSGEITRAVVGKPGKHEPAVCSGNILICMNGYIPRPTEVK